MTASPDEIAELIERLERATPSQRRLLNVMAAQGDSMPAVRLARALFPGRDPGPRAGAVGKTLTSLEFAGLVHASDFRESFSLARGVRATLRSITTQEPTDDC